MSFDKGGKIKTQLVALADGKFEATDTSITTDIITIKDKYSRNNLAKFGDLTVLHKQIPIKLQFRLINYF
ncbi:MAG: hypothetical protein SPJ14_04535 [Succinivibrio sp.]|nr:hypothetical protein [Succinivibrio sp.]